MAVPITGMRKKMFRAWTIIVLNSSGPSHYWAECAMAVVIVLLGVLITFNVPAGQT